MAVPVPRLRARATGQGTSARSLPHGPGIVWFGTAGLVNAFGTGFFYPFSLLFFTRTSGLSLGAVGIVLTITALAALPVLPGVGRLIDQRGPRWVLLVAALLRAVCFVGFVAMHGIIPLAVFGTALALGNRAEQASVPLLAVGLAPRGESGRWLALSRVVFNGGIGAGALVASLLVVGTASGFDVLGLINAVSFLLTAALYLKLPARERATRAGAATPARSAGGRPWRDLSFLRVAAARALLGMAALTMESALPVYVLSKLAMPAWSVGALFAVNTVLLTLLQLPVSRLLERLPQSSVLAAGGLCYGILYVTAVTAGFASPGARLCALLMAMCVYTLGELAVSQAALVMLTRIPPQTERAGYMAFNQVFVGVATALAPLLAGSLLGTFPAMLWWILTATSVLAALLALRAPVPDGAERGMTGD